VGFTNIWPGVVTAAAEGSVVVEVAGATLHVARPSIELPVGSTVDVMIRAERVNLRREHADPTGTNLIAGRNIEHFAYGNTHQLTFAPEGAGPTIQVEIAARPYEVLGVPERAAWLLELPPEDLHLALR
jgi:hypothetical protein